MLTNGFLMSRAQYHYVPDEWESLIQTEGLTISELARHGGVSERHVYNILEKEVRTARFKTMKKLREGLHRRGFTSESTSKLFEKK